MYDALTNVLGWGSTILGVLALLQVLFTYNRDYTLGLVALLFGAAVWVLTNLIETKLTSSQLGRKTRGQCFTAVALSLAAVLLIATSDPAKRPAPTADATVSRFPAALFPPAG
ncbi:MAG: hypothetical protein ABI743_09895 [bacterium]